MKNKEFYFSSANKNARMRAVEWLPEREPKAVLHIFRGIEKTTCCQEELAEFFREHGFVVVESFCQDNVSKSQSHAAMLTCLNNVKRKYPDAPYLLLGLSRGAAMVYSFVNNHPDAVEGVVLAGSEQQPCNMDKDIPVLFVPEVEEKRQETFRYIYHWTEECLDEMLYRAATKH